MCVGLSGCGVQQAVGVKQDYPRQIIQIRVPQAAAADYVTVRRSLAQPVLKTDGSWLER